MQEIPREDFLEAIALRRPDLVSEFLEATLFLTDGKNFLSLALNPEQKMIWISGILGQGLDWMRWLKRWGLYNGYEWIGFKVKAGLPWGEVIARYSKARLMAVTPSGNEFCASLNVRSK